MMTEQIQAHLDEKIDEVYDLREQRARLVEEVARIRYVAERLYRHAGHIRHECALYEETPGVYDCTCGWDELRGDYGRTVLGR